MRTTPTSWGRALARLGVAAAVAAALAACEPSDRTPGQWLRGETVATLPADWSFTDAHEEIFVEVATPYFIPHSVTIWCAQVDGTLYIGARNPGEKRWVGWMEERPAIRLEIDGRLYDVAAEPLTDEAAVAAVREAYTEKYALPEPAGDAPVAMRYWRIIPRE